MGRWPTGTRRPGWHDLRLGHAGPAQRWVDVERVGRDAIAHPARIVVEQVRRDDLEIVVGGMREGAAPVAIAQRPDVGQAGANLVVHRDIAVFVAPHPGVVEAEIVAVGTAADREQQMRTDDLRRAVRTPGRHASRRRCMWYRSGRRCLRLRGSPEPPATLSHPRVQSAVVAARRG